MEGKIIFPGFDKEQGRLGNIDVAKVNKTKSHEEKQKARIARAVAKAEKRTKKQAAKQERQKYIKMYSKDIPWVPKECLNVFALMSFIVLVLMVLAVDVGQILTKKLDSGYADWSWRSFMASETVVGASLCFWMLIVLKFRRFMIYEAAKSFVSHNKDLIRIEDDILSKNPMASSKSYGFKLGVCGRANGIERRLWEKEFAQDRAHFECLMRVAQENGHDIDYAGAALVIQGHLKAHPEDVHCVLNMFDPNTIPRVILDKYGHTR